MYLPLILKTSRIRHVLGPNGFVNTAVKRRMRHTITLHVHRRAPRKS